MRPIYLVAVLVLSACRNSMTGPTERICDSEMRAIYAEKVAAGVFADNTELPFLLEQNPWSFDTETIYFSAVDGKCVVDRKPNTSP